MKEKVLWLKANDTVEDITDKGRGTYEWLKKYWWKPRKIITITKRKKYKDLWLKEGDLKNMKHFRLTEKEFKAIHKEFKKLK